MERPDCAGARQFTEPGLDRGERHCMEKVLLNVQGGIHPWDSEVRVREDASVKYSNV